ncbi:MULTISPECIES: PepSY domain-containing protein [unclassified Streptomyces]|uniref:PepSY domain-containing protein n=1 Tax=unclassified Streptomyces TaxID=2593676 RepID=UPI00331FAA3A
MKRKILISAVAVAALVGGGTYTAVAASADDAAPTPKVTVSEAVDAALQKAPGTVESAGTDDDAGGWEVDVRGKNGDDREVTVDASGKASAAKDDKSDDDRSDDSDDSDDDAADHKALSAAKVDARQASAAALEFRPGTVTEVEFDDGHWEVDVRGKDGASHDVTVDATTGKASASQDDAKDADDSAADDAKGANSASDDGTSKDKADDGSDD